MKIFLSYARADWRKAPKALGREQYGFIERLETFLQRPGRGRVEIWYDKDLEAGLEWRNELGKHIEEAALILVFYSPSWIASEVCWQEYRHAVTHNPQAEILPIWLEHVDSAQHMPFAGYETDFKALHARFQAIHVGDAERDLGQQGGSLRQHLSAAYLSPEERESRMNALAEPYADMLDAAIKRSSKSVKSGSAAKGPPPVSETRNVIINGASVPFVEIPAGIFTTEAGHEIAVPKGFLIMQDARPASELLAGLTSPEGQPLTFAHLGKRIFPLRNVPHKLALPNEDQWDLALSSCFAHSHGTLLNDVHPTGVPRSHSGLTAPADNAKEAVFGFERPRRPFQDLTRAGQTNAALKWVSDGGVRYAIKRRDAPLGRTLLRLVMPLRR